MIELKTSDDWQKELCPHTTILDPDGWDRSDFQYSFYKERITKEEFWSRLCESTVISKVDNYETSNRPKPAA